MQARGRADDLYAVLGVEPSATAEAITSAFRARVRELRPDTRVDAATAERFGEVRAAYDTLRDPVRRAAYDRGCARARGRGRVEAPPARPARRPAVTPEDGPAVVLGDGPAVVLVGGPAVVLGDGPVVVLGGGPAVVVGDGPPLLLGDALPEPPLRAGPVRWEPYR